MVFISCGLIVLASTTTMTNDDSIQRRFFRFLRIAVICQLVFVSTCQGFVRNLAASRRHYNLPSSDSISIGAGAAAPPHLTTITDQCITTGSHSRAALGVVAAGTSSRTASATRLYESSSSTPPPQSSPSSSSSSSSPSSKQTKPPRFVQKAHTQNKKRRTSMDSSSSSSSSRSSTTSSASRSSSSNTNTNNFRRPRGPPLPPGVMNTEKSIEEMENIMMKRWGTLEGAAPSPSTSSPKQRNSKKKSAAGNPQNPFQRPVLDPWAKEEEQATSTTLGKKKNNNNAVREFYDEDDEGFEIMELDDDDDGYDDSGDLLTDGEWEWEDEKGGPSSGAAKKEDRSPRMQISHLISPKPVGGRGTNQEREVVRGSPAGTSKRQQLQKEGSSSSSSYFFNPNKQQTTQEPVKQGNSKQSAAKETVSSNKADQTKKASKESVSSSSSPTTTTKQSTRADQAKAIVDDDGNPVMMTTEEALVQFQSSTSLEAVAAMMSDDEGDSPMVAYQQQQQQQQDEEPSSWSKIGITSEPLLDNLNAMHCAAPLSVQEKAIPSVLTGNDVLIGTYTGSGKTLAFLTPLIQRLLWNGGVDGEGFEDFEDPGLAVLIVAPGRELASQIVSVARTLLQDTPLKVQLAIGGTTFSRNLEQIRKRKPNIVVGTPGRIAELVVGKPGEKSGKLKIGNLQSLVLDEFDALLEYKAHREPTRATLQSLRRRHGDALQSILCSATASDLMDSPKVTDYLRPGFATAMADENDIFVTDSSKSSSKHQRPQVSRTVLHGVVHVPHRRFALDTVRRILHTEPIPQQILIFVESARKVDVVIDKLAERGIIAAPLHGGQGSDKMDRAEVSKALREGYVGIVVATELAARGLDAPLLTHVINLDLPTDASHYAHRAGRCGRGGRPGVVINMTTSPKERNVPKRFGESLGIDMHTVEPRQGKLIMVDPETQTLDE